MREHPTSVQRAHRGRPPRRSVLLVAVVLAWLPMWGGMVAAQSRPAGEEPALARFHAQVAAYLALRARVAQEVGTPLPNSTAAQITATSDALARAIQRARPNRRQGTFFDPAAAAAVRASIRDLLVRHPTLLQGIDDEVPPPRTPGVYARFPGPSPVVTMPPSFLATLPPLPPELEYRLVGGDLVLRDVAAALVLDILPKAVPRR